MNIELEIKSALQWFKDNDVPAYKVDDNIYVQAFDADIQISTSEILYRAELQDEFIREDAQV
jgi:hypothetical protein